MESFLTTGARSGFRALRIQHIDAADAEQRQQPLAGGLTAVQHVIDVAG